MSRIDNVINKSLNIKLCNVNISIDYKLFRQVLTNEQNSSYFTEMMWHFSGFVAEVPFETEQDFSSTVAMFGR